ncbi:unnamed protein product, partial [Choristocarpus tenellus]
MRTTTIAPLALHQVVVVPPGGEAVIRLPGYDLDGDELEATITSLPSSGGLYQLSKVFSQYGYDPKAGDLITTQAVVTGSGNRVLYRRPTMDAEPQGAWGRFTYTVMDGSKTAKDGTIFLVSSDGRLAASEFSTGAGDWQVCQNDRLGCNTARHEPSSRGLMNYFISGLDSIVHT